MIYYGVRFTPTQANAKVTGAKVYTGTQGGAGACTAMVYTGKDFGSYVLPETRKDKATFSPSSGGWVNINFPGQPVIASGDFFILVTSGQNANVGIAIDNSLGYSNRQYGSDDLNDWYYMSVPGDFLIHAFVTYVGVEEGNEAKNVVELKISPNPIVERTSISYTLKNKSEVELKIYDAAGKLVRTLEQGIYDAGVRTAEWNARDNNGRKVSAGTYFCKLKAGNADTITRMLIVL